MTFSLKSNRVWRFLLLVINMVFCVTLNAWMHSSEPSVLFHAWVCRVGSAE